MHQVTTEDTDKIHDYYPDWDDPFGPDFIIEYHGFEGRLLLTDVNFKYNTLILDLNGWRNL